MDNLTHSLVGLAAAKAGLERVSPWATATCIIAANAPDADLVTAIWGRWAYLEHHRGITHSIIGTLALAIIIPLLLYAAEALYARTRGRPRRARFHGLLLASLILSATHPLVDWTNNYGVRPFLPWSDAWHYGDLVFIIDPWLWLALGGSAFLVTAQKRWQRLAWGTLALVVTAAIFFFSTRTGEPYPPAFKIVWMIALISLIITYRARIAERALGGAALPLAILALIVVYWAALSIAHNAAFNQAQLIAGRDTAAIGERLERIAAMPMFADPRRWRCIVETDRATYRFDLTLNRVDRVDWASSVRYEKPHGEERMVERAAMEYRAKVFLGFARFPVTRVQINPLGDALVKFADLRYTEPDGAPRGAFAVDIPVSPQ